MEFDWNSTKPSVDNGTKYFAIYTECSITEEEPSYLGLSRCSYIDNKDWLPTTVSIFGASGKAFEDLEI